MGSRLHFANTTAEYAVQDGLCQKNTVHFVEVGSSNGEGYVPFSIIQAFCSMMKHSIDAHEGELVVICLEDLSPSSSDNARLLCGAYLILCELLCVNEVMDIFKDVGIRGSSHDVNQNTPHHYLPARDSLAQTLRSGSGPAAPACPVGRSPGPWALMECVRGQADHDHC